MGRMIDLIKESKLPANIMRSASKGALSVAPAEMVEILVYLAGHPLFGNDAKLTLAGWDEKVAKSVVGDPKTSQDVLNYFTSVENLRIPLLSTLLDNSSVTEQMMVSLAMQASSRVLATMLWHPRVLASKSTLHAISMNLSLPEEDSMVVRSALANLGEDTEHLIEQSHLDADADEIAVPDDILNAELDRYTREHADEIAAEEGSAFEMYYVEPAEEQGDLGLSGPVEPTAIGGAGEVPTLLAAATRAPVQKAEAAAPDPSLRKRVSAFLKISRLSVGERVQLAMKGTKEERFVLIRDGSKVVSSAVLESPKVSEREVEMFSSLKNVQESVLRGIAMKRKFMRIYSVQKNLVNNPRAPLNVTLPLLKGLMINDLRGMCGNKNVNDTLRKMAIKLYKQRTEKKKSD